MGVKFVTVGHSDSVVGLARNTERDVDAQLLGETAVGADLADAPLDGVLDDALEGVTADSETTDGAEPAAQDVDGAQAADATATAAADHTADSQED